MRKGQGIADLKDRKSLDFIDKALNINKIEIAKLVLDKNIITTRSMTKEGT